MRSDLVFGAMKQVSNRFLLTRALAKATRKFHKPGTRVQDTTNDVLTRFGCASLIGREDAVPIAKNIPTRRDKPPLAITHQSKRPNIPAVLEGQRALAEASRPSGNWAKG